MAETESDLLRQAISDHFDYLHCTVYGRMLDVKHEDTRQQAIEWMAREVRAIVDRWESLLISAVGERLPLAGEGESIPHWDAVVEAMKLGNRRGAHRWHGG